MQKPPVVEVWGHYHKRGLMLGSPTPAAAVGMKGEVESFPLLLGYGQHAVLINRDEALVEIESEAADDLDTRNVRFRMDFKVLRFKNFFHGSLLSVCLECLYN
jgi:hypothetical protein